MAKANKFSRRKFIQAAGAGAAALGGGLVPLRARSQKRASKTLKICRWSHFVPAFDSWFIDKYVKEWGEKNDTEVIVDTLAVTAINGRAAAEVSMGKGHDLFWFSWPPAAYEEMVIDHKEVYQECEKKYGAPIPLAVRSTYNPKTKKYFAFPENFAPDPINYRSDLWGEIGVKPDSWDAIRQGGKKIKVKTGIPVGIGQSAEVDTSMAMLAILYSFGASVQDENNQLALNSKNTLEAVKFVKALYQEAMTPEVLAWDPASNNRAMLSGKASLVVNAISITREAESKGIDIGSKILLLKAAQGPLRRLGAPNQIGAYVIWKFSENKEGAKKFLVDYVGNFRAAFLASEFFNFPCFSKLVPDLEKLISKDERAKPADKYAVLADAFEWSASLGYPGYVNAAVDEVFATWILNTMFAQASTGASTPEQAIKEAEAKCRRIWAKWQQRKLI
jgi:multiple sugar transport system substrate-binding protein